MNTSLSKWLIGGSIALFIISLGLIIFTDLYSRSDTDYILFNALMVLILSISVIISLISLRFENNRIFRRIITILAFLLPVYIFINLAPEEWINVSSDTAIVFFFTGFLLSSAAAAIYIFILSKADSVLGLVLIVIYLVLCIILRQIYEFADEDTIVFGFFVFGPGLVMFGIRSLFVLHNNNYLIILTCWICILIYLVSWEIIWINPDSAQITLVIYTVLIFLTTLMVLFSLPFSGYIQWNDMHKRILKKLIIPWVFVLLIVSLRFIFPGLGNVLFREKQNDVQEFGMRDYDPVNKNGLEPGQVR